MYKYILKQLKRGVVLNVAFCLLLALAGTLMSLGAGLLVSARNSAQISDEMFTTIALPDASVIRQYAVNQVKNLNEYETDYAVLSRDHPVWGERFDQYAADHMTDVILREIEETVYSSPLVKLDPRRYFGAYSHDIIPLKRINKQTGLGYNGSPNDGAAFVARCVGATDYYYMNFTPGEDNYDKPILEKTVIFEFEVEEIILLYPKHEDDKLKNPKRLLIDSYNEQFGGGHLFKEGGRYLISAGYYGIDANGPFLLHDYGPDTPEKRPVVADTITTIEELDALDIYNDWYFSRDMVLEWEDFFPIDAMSAIYTEELPYPMVFELGETSYEDALKGEHGEKIKYSLSIVEKGNYQLHILTTENINSYFNFNQFRTNLSDGREFTDEETQSGARVCLIPKELAEENGIATGDVIQLTMFPNSFWSYLVTHFDNPYRSYRKYNAGFYYAGVPESGPTEFEVVGIYTAGGLGLPDEQDAHAIPLNMIFIPDRSVEGFPDYDGLVSVYEDFDAYNPLINVIVVKNGKNDEFRETIDSIIPGYSNFFKLYDQGYSVIKSAIENLTRNGTLILILSAAGWIITLVMFCLFFILRKKKDAGLLYALGVKRKDCFRWVFAHCLAVILIAQLVAFGASLALHEVSLDFAYKTAESDANETKLGYDIFTNALVAADGAKNEFELARNPLVIVATAGAQTLILLAVAGGMSSAMVKKGVKSLKGADI